MDREKVIKGLETCIPMKYETNEEKECRHEQCPYGRENYKPMNGCFWDLMSDALELLKEQKHGETFTVIDTKTGKEADEYNIALYEDWAKHLCYCDMDGWAIMDDGTLLLVDECGRFAYADRERFKVKWE